MTIHPIVATRRLSCEDGELQCVCCDATITPTEAVA